MQWKTTIFVCCGALFFFAHVTLSQTSNIQPKFDVASIKPNVTNERMDYGGQDHGLFGKNISLQGWIQIAYEVRSYQIIGPAWMADEKFDIEAKTEREVSGGDTRRMLQSLLADRFHLALHRETRELPVYALVVDRKGLRMKPSADQTLWAGDYPDGSPDGSEITGGGPTELAPGRFAGQAIQMKMFLTLLSDPLGRTVVNRTALTGRFDIDLRYAPGSGQAQTVETDAGLPSIFTALQEQLGLRLESTNGPVDVLVIDHVERPSQN